MASSSAAVRLIEEAMNRRRFSDGSEPFPASVAEFAAFMRIELVKWGAIVRDIGLRID